MTLQAIVTLVSTSPARHFVKNGKQFVGRDRVELTNDLVQVVAVEIEFLADKLCSDKVPYDPLSRTLLRLENKCYSDLFSRPLHQVR